MFEDSGYYQCVAGNSYGYDGSSFIVEVVDTGMSVLLKSI